MLCCLKHPQLGLAKGPTKWSCKYCRRENTVERLICSNCYKPQESKDTVPVSRKDFLLYGPLPDPPKSKRYCICGVKLLDSEIKCGMCGVVSPGKREGNNWKCLKCGQNNYSERECRGKRCLQLSVRSVEDLLLQEKNSARPANTNRHHSQ